MIRLSNGVEISEDTVINALEEAGISTTPKHIFEAGDVAYIYENNNSVNWRLIISIHRKLKSVNQFGWIQGDGSQEYFKNNHYKYAGKQKDLLNK